MIKCYLCNGTKESGCNCHEGVKAVMQMGEYEDYEARIKERSDRRSRALYQAK